MGKKTGIVIIAILCVVVIAVIASRVGVKPDADGKTADTGTTELVAPAGDTNATENDSDADDVSLDGEPSLDSTEDKDENTTSSEEILIPEIAETSEGDSLATQGGADEGAVEESEPGRELPVIWLN